MKTNFFRMLDRLHPKGDWRINVTAKDGKMCVAILPLKGEIGQSIPPMVLSASPEELDQGFYSAIETPVEDTLSLFVNLSEHAQSIERAKLALKEKAVKPVASASAGADLKTAFEDAIKKVQELNSACKYSDALALLPAIETYPDKKAEIEKLKAELERKNAQLNLL